MIGFIMLGTNSLDKAINFYDILLNNLDVKRVLNIKNRYAGYAHQNKPEEIQFYITTPFNGEKATFGNGTQTSFKTISKENVEKFYNTGISLGGKSEGAPSVKSDGYYCYIRDLDGNKICAYTNIK